MAAAPDGGYVAPPSIGHEMGIMFGFLALMAISMALYGLAWQMGNKRSSRKERERIEALRASGWLKEKIPEGGEEERREVVGGVDVGGSGSGRDGEITEIKM